MPAASLPQDCHPQRNARAFAPTLGRAGAQPKDLRFCDSLKRLPWFGPGLSAPPKIPPSPLFFRAKY